MQRLHLIPISNTSQQVLEWKIEIQGGSVELETTDFHGNSVQLCRQDPSADSLIISSNGKVEVTNNDGIVGRMKALYLLPYSRDPQVCPDLDRACVNWREK